MVGENLNSTFPIFKIQNKLLKVTLGEKILRISGYAAYLLTFGQFGFYMTH